jgi:type III pantothenate kinase
MYEGAARLPSIELGSQTRAIGKNSESSARAGVLLGNAFAIDGFVSKISEEMRLDISEIHLIATGKYAPDILKGCKNKFEYDRYLSLKGLYYIFKNNL